MNPQTEKAIVSSINSIIDTLSLIAQSLEQISNIHKQSMLPQPSVQEISFDSLPPEIQQACNQTFNAAMAQLSAEEVEAVTEGESTEPTEQSEVSIKSSEESVTEEQSTPSSETEEDPLDDGDEDEETEE